MKQNDNFAYFLSRFLTEYLPGQRNLSANTIQSYRDTFVKLIVFCQDVKKIRPDKLKLRYLDRTVIEEFLDYLENDQGCCISTRNQRLAAIKSFFKYVQVEEPQQLYTCQNILGIICKKKDKPIITYLTAEEVQALLKCPDTTTRKGRRDLALLSLLYDTGARVQEMCDTKSGDIRLDSTPVICLYGKGRKGREIPLSKGCAEIMKRYVNENHLNQTGYKDRPLFCNSRNEKLTRSGISFILKKYMDRIEETTGMIIDKKITPHCLRHSKAMHLVESGVNLIYIRDFLGHESVETTQIYAKANPEAVRKAISKANETEKSIGMPDWRDDPDIMAMLKSI